MTDGIKLTTIFKCSRPILFKNDDPIYTYSFGGTCFIVCFKNYYFVITAKHVFNNFQPVQVHVQYRQDGDDFLPLKQIFLRKSISKEDTDCFDIAIFSIDQEKLDMSLFHDNEPYNLLEIDKFTIYAPKSQYVYRGFPIETRTFNWLERHIEQASVLAQAEYVGSSSFGCCHELRLLNLSILQSIDGFSGSPVFQINHVDDIYSVEAFAGMLVRGTRESETAHFMEHKSIIQALKDVKNGKHHEFEIYDIV